MAHHHEELVGGRELAGYLETGDVFSSPDASGSEQVPVGGGTIAPTVRFHGQKLVEVLASESVRVYYSDQDPDRPPPTTTGLSPPGGPSNESGYYVRRLSLSSTLSDKDKLRRIYDLSPTFPNLCILEISGNMLSCLENLEGLTHLTELNLARNKLRSLEGLEALEGSLTKLDVSGNLLTSLGDGGSIQRCGLLEWLDASGNNLKALKEVVEPLKPLAHLQYLNCSVNPVCLVGSQHYTLYMVFHLRSLVTLDGATVNDGQRHAAHLKFGDISKVVVRSELEKKDALHQTTVLQAAKDKDHLQSQIDSLREQLRLKTELLQSSTSSCAKMKRELSELKFLKEMQSLDMSSSDYYQPSTTTTTSSTIRTHHWTLDSRGDSLCLSTSQPPRLSLEGHEKGLDPFKTPVTKQPNDKGLAPQPAPTTDQAMRAISGAGGSTNGGGEKTTPFITPQPPPTPAAMDQDESSLAIPLSLSLSTEAMSSRNVSMQDVVEDQIEDAVREEELLGPLTRLALSPVPVTTTPATAIADARPPPREERVDGDTPATGDSTSLQPRPETREAQAKLRAQANLLKQRISDKTLILSRVRACVAMLRQQLEASRRESGDTDTSSGNYSSTPHRGRAHMDVRSRQLLVEEKLRHYHKLQKHVDRLETRLVAIKDAIVSHTMKLVQDNSSTASLMPYEDFLMDLSKSMEVAQDEVAAVRSRLGRLNTEIETLQASLGDRLRVIYKPTIPLASPTSKSSPERLAGWPSLGQWSLTLSDLEDDGGCLIRLAGESCSEFILRLRHRLRAALALEKQSQSELDSMVSELEETKRILAQMERQEVTHEVVVARQESRITKDHAHALLEAMEGGDLLARDDRPDFMTPADEMKHMITTMLEQERRQRLLVERSSHHHPPLAAASIWERATPVKTPAKSRSRFGQSYPTPSSSTIKLPMKTPPPASSSVSTPYFFMSAPQQQAPLPPPPPFFDSAGDSMAAMGEGESFQGSPLPAMPPALLALSPVTLFRRKREAQNELLQVEDQEVMDHDVGIAVDHRTGTHQGKLEVTVLDAKNLPSATRDKSGGAKRRADAFVLITMDPITSCLSRTGAFGSHPAGAYLFKTGTKPDATNPVWGEKFVIKPVYKRLAALRLVVMETARTPGGKDQAIGEVTIPLMTLKDQRAHTLCLQLTQSSWGGRKRPSQGESSNGYMDSISSTPSAKHQPPTGGSIRVRVRFTFSRALALHQKIEMLTRALTMQDPAMDLAQLEREALQRDRQEREDHAAPFSPPYRANDRCEAFSFPKDDDVHHAVSHARAPAALTPPVTVSIPVPVPEHSSPVHRPTIRATIRRVVKRNDGRGSGERKDPEEPEEHKEREELNPEANRPTTPQQTRDSTTQPAMGRCSPPPPPTTKPASPESEPEKGRRDQEEYPHQQQPREAASSHNPASTVDSLTRLKMTMSKFQQQQRDLEIQLQGGAATTPASIMRPSQGNNQETSAPPNQTACSSTTPIASAVPRPDTSECFDVNSPYYQNPFVSLYPHHSRDPSRLTVDDLSGPCVSSPPEPTTRPTQNPFYADPSPAIDLSIFKRSSFALPYYASYPQTRDRSSTREAKRAKRSNGQTMGRGGRSSGSSTSVISGRYVGIDAYETKWRKEVIERLA